ncbi:nucleotide sugar dehydrogenase [Blastopirellula sp. JC732]|uniref:Nucleotide sugar dehydrogenase n=1 Tax=Blastopirellula sediminis TaxID=2894196 RepID=A0A9X1MUA1_9BACT|nr:nucleotide sugar dehydrogenase [Blastopirellula sediminis]MCC9604489.1 nucleotide sugar dehydrogenase [Blastopirellula sediminis]MCC9632212.1 nucleotide sugar dehydrogenase [Blastopirellula sediminis]
MSKPASTDQLATQLHQAILGKEAKVGVIGLGYVGLPLVQAFIGSDFSALGFDVDQKKVDALSRGESYIKHVDSKWIADWVKSGRFAATSDPQRLSEADVLLICVPTPLNTSRDPDLTYVESTAQMIAENLRPGQLVVLESTTYPGTTRDVVAPILTKSGLTPGVDFFLAYSPEREDPGNPNFTASGIPKVVGGYDPVSLKLADAFYAQAVVKTIPVSSCEVAEACKILENTYRAVNIALVNELKLLFDRLDIDVWEVIEAAKTKPFGFQAFYPGPGLGGHCIPIDPFYLSWLARANEMPTRFIELAGEINTSMPQYVVQKLSDALNDVRKPTNGSKVLILGAAYKKNVDDPRESPTFKIMELLTERGAVLSYNDPFIPKLPAMRHYDLPPLESVPLTPENLASFDAVMIVTDHDDYDYQQIVDHSQLLIDTRNATKNVTKGREKIIRA